MKNEETVTDCNQLKLREALLKILGIVDHMQYRYAAMPELIAKDILELKQIAESALSAPPRNYDLYATEAERLDAFIAYYNETFDLKGEYAFDTYDLKHNVDGIFNDYINWLFAEAKGE